MEMMIKYYLVIDSEDGDEIPKKIFQAYSLENAEDVAKEMFENFMDGFSCNYPVVPAIKITHENMPNFKEEIDVMSDDKLDYYAETDFDEWKDNMWHYHIEDENGNYIK